MQDPSFPRQRPLSEQVMLARHLSLQASEYVSFEHTRHSGPLCPGSHILMTVSGVVVGGPVVLVVGAGVVLLIEQSSPLNPG